MPEEKMIICGSALSCEVYNSSAFQEKHPFSNGAVIKRDGTGCYSCMVLNEIGETRTYNNKNDGCSVIDSLNLSVEIQEKLKKLPI